MESFDTLVRLILELIYSAPLFFRYTVYFEKYLLIFQLIIFQLISQNGKWFNNLKTLSYNNVFFYFLL